MAKRRRVQSCSESESSTFSATLNSGHASDDSFSEIPRSTRARKKSKNARRTRKITSQTTFDTHNPVTGIADQSHSAALHVVGEVNEIRNALLEWYDQIHELRGMPWRKPFDSSLGKEGRAQRAYEVWISEIMLQQTQVMTVIPYYKKWMAKYPTIGDLAASDIETVNNLWKGLGYYSRAARLLSGAQKVVRELDGRLPDNAIDMQAKIPGVGRYSAGAICSIAYNQCVPVLDGNVHRLLSRFLALYAPPKSKQTQDVLWNGAEAFVEASSRPGDINQALIELGSTVCKVRDPACSDCALRPWCRAYQRTHSTSPGNVDKNADIEECCRLCVPAPNDDQAAGLVTIYPMKVERKKAREELDLVNVIEWRMKEEGKRWFVLVRRPEEGLLAGLQEFPTIPNITGSSATTTGFADTLNALLENLLLHPPPSFHQKLPESRESVSRGNTYGSLCVARIERAGDVVHVFSHIKKTYRVQWVVLKGGGEQPPELRNELTSTTVSTGGKNGDKRRRRKRLCDSEGTAARGSGSRPSNSLAHRWVPLDEVGNANIGTGVMKVWKLAKTLWGDMGR
ncbi:DNA glycosylase [Phlebopus sp. FC_14]|nr:DNA glycosylase [Phlebopus sp. FC_14]